MTPKEVGQLHNDTIRSWLPQLRKGAGLRFVFRNTALLALRRGWTDKERLPDLLRWMKQLVRQRRNHDFVPPALSPASQAYIGQLISIARAANEFLGGSAELQSQALAIARPVVSAHERLVTDVALSVLIHSAKLWEEEAQVKREAGEGDLDVGDIVESDVDGAVAGAMFLGPGLGIVGLLLHPYAAGAGAAAGVLIAALYGAIEFSCGAYEIQNALDPKKTLEEEGGESPTSDPSGGGEEPRN